MKADGDVMAAAVLAGVVDGNDVGMAQPGGGPGLAQEALDALRTVEGARPRHLEGDFAVELRVVGAVDRAERAGAEAGSHLEAADLGRLAGGHRGCRVRPTGSLDGGGLERELIAAGITTAAAADQ